MDVIFDFGNARGKWFIPYSGTEGDFIHAISELSENEWRKVAGRGRTTPGIVRINDRPYAIGNAARRYLIKDRPRGAARYRADYYGVGLAYMLSEAFNRSSGNIYLMASYPPGDVEYVPRLVDSAKGEWRVEGVHGKQTFCVNTVRTFDEPLGGYSHFAFNKDGTDYRRNPYKNSTVLVLDVGGYTVDVAAIDPGGEIDVRSLDSTRTGVIDMTASFERELRANNRDLFQDTGDIDPRRIENALLSGIYKFGKVEVPCHEEAHASIWELVNDVVGIVSGAGGVANFDAILVTGGGAALIYDHLQAALSNIDLVMVEPNRDKMMYANVFGGAKILALLRRLRV